MFLVWHGYGIVVPIIVFLDSLLAEMLTRSLSNDAGYFQENHIPLGCSFMVSAIIIRTVASILFNRDKLLFPLSSDATLFGRHRFFFIPLIYWSLIMLLLGVIVVVVQLLQ